MAKTRFTDEKRQAVFKWMIGQYDEKEKKTGTLAKLHKKAVDAMSAAIRKKYPEADMAVLRKYDCTRRDQCLRFVDADTNHFFGFDFGYDKTPAELADVPIGKGCRTNDVFPISPTGRKYVEGYAQAITEAKEARDLKKRDYNSLLMACRYIEDAHEVVPMPEDMQKRLFSGGAMIAVNEELIAQIKSEFKA